MIILCVNLSIKIYFVIALDIGITVGCIIFILLYFVIYKLVNVYIFVCIDHKSRIGDKKDEESVNKEDENSLEPSSSTEEVNAFRNKLQIKVKGAEVPNPGATFSVMKISKGMKQIILENIEKSAWKEPTAIQMQVIPCMLMGRDVLATAPTGSGMNAHSYINI